MKRRATLLILAGVVAAVAAGLVVWYLINSVARQAEQQAAAPPTPVVASRDVLIAATDIAANSVITYSQVTTGSYPVNLVPADAITNTNKLIGSTARTNVFSGQILLERQFLAAGGATGASISIPKGKVLVAFPATDMLNSTGAVQPSDRVDILLSIPISGTTRLDAGATAEAQSNPGQRSLVSQATLQNVEVYSVGYWAPPGQQAAPTADQRQNGLKVITFIVDHQEALILKYVKDSGGTIDLAVRSAADTDTVQTDPVTLDYLVDLYGFIGLQQTKPKP